MGGKWSSSGFLLPELAAEDLEEKFYFEKKYIIPEIQRGERRDGDRTRETSSSGYSIPKCLQQRALAKALVWNLELGCNLSLSLSHGDRHLST